MSNKQNKKVMSIAIEPELHDSVKEYAKRKGVSTSSYISELVHKALKINIDEEPIVVGKPVDGNIMSIAVSDSVQKYAEHRGISVSSYVSELVQKASKIHVDEEPIVVGKPIDGNIMAVVLKIPSELKGKKEALTEWLASQCTAMVKQLAP